MRFGRKKNKAGSVIKLIAAVLGSLIAVAFVTFAVMFVLEAFFHIDTPLPPDGVVGDLANRFNIQLVVSPTPYITPEPTPTPYPMDDFIAESEEKEVVFPADFTYSWLGDPYCYDKKIVCSAGRLIDGSVRMFRLVEFNTETGVMRELSVDAKNDHLLFPAFNDRWLVYFDANYNIGGGNICALDLTDRTARPVVIKQVYIGQPEIKLYDNYISWIERTGSDRDKIFVCDLSTQETTVIHYFDKSDYGTSIPSFGGGCLCWAAEDSSMPSLSSIRYISLDSSTVYEYRPGTYVHDPEYNGKYFAWLDSNHAEGTNLYVSDTASEPELIASGVTEFGLSDSFIAYGVDNAVYMYVFDNGLTYRVSPERETTQFLGVSGGAVMWMDVTSRERDIIKFAFPPV